MPSAGSWYERQRPPAWVAASCTLTFAEPCASRTAAARPARPAPITCTLIREGSRRVGTGFRKRSCSALDERAAHNDPEKPRAWNVDRAARSGPAALHKPVQDHAVRIGHDVRCAHRAPGTAPHDAFGLCKMPARAIDNGRASLPQSRTGQYGGWIGRGDTDPLQQRARQVEASQRGILIEVAHY